MTRKALIEWLAHSMKNCEKVQIAELVVTINVPF
jgi:hypothetical protein